MDTIVLVDLSRIHSCSVFKSCSIYLYLKQRHARTSAHARLPTLFLTNASPILSASAVITTCVGLTRIIPCQGIRKVPMTSIYFLRKFVFAQVTESQRNL
jgi:hypothetical protein